MKPRSSLVDSKTRIEANLENGQRAIDIGKEKAGQLDIVFQDVASGANAEQRFYIGAADWVASDIFIRDRRGSMALPHLLPNYLIN